MNANVIRALKSTLAAVALAAAHAAHAEIIVLSGAMDNLQVVAPVYGDPNDPDKVTGSTHFRADGVTPISTSTATGFARVTIDTVALTMVTEVQWQGLTGPADRAHLHDAPLGETRLLSPPNDRFFHEVINFDVDANGDPTSTVVGGPVMCSLDPSSDYYSPDPNCAPATGSLVDVLVLDPSRWEPFGPSGIYGTDGTLEMMLAVFVAEGLFLDYHSEVYPGGEIRGQLRVGNVPEPGSILLIGLGLAALAMQRRSVRR
jgi:hypothetical protein